MLLTLFRTLTLCGLFVFGLAASARAEEPGPNDEEARALFQAGKVAYDHGRYQDSLSYFQRAYELSQRPGLHYNIGLAQDRLRHDEDAIRSFEAYLLATPDSERADEVRARIDSLRRAVEERNRLMVSPNADADATDEEAEGQASWARSWWLWTGVAVVAVAGAAVTVAVLAKDDNEARPEPNSGVRIEALSW